MNKILSQFIEKVNDGEREFEIQNNVFMSRKNGNAIYYYVFNDIGKDDHLFITGWYGKQNYELCAIFSKGKIYLSPCYAFDKYQNIADLPEKVINMREFVEQCNNELRGKIYQDYYNIIHADPIEPDVDYLGDIINRCRWKMVSDIEESEAYSAPKSVEFTDNDAFVMLAYGNTLDIAYGEILDREYKKILGRKQKNLTEEKLIIEGKVASPWEIRMAKAIKETAAKTFTIVFEFKGKTASAKIKKEELKGVFAHNNYFSCFNFVSRAEGKKLLQELNASDISWKNSDNCIYLKNIKTISYKTKTIYDRDMKEPE